MSISSKGNASYGSYLRQREIWHYFLGETISYSQWESYLARTETTILVIDGFPRAKSWRISIHNLFSTFERVEHPVRRWEQGVQSVSLSPQTSVPKFEWCDPPLKFVAIFDRKSEGNWSFSTLLNLAFLMLIFLTLMCFKVISDALRWRRQNVFMELSFHYEQNQLWKYNIAWPCLSTQIRERTKVCNIRYKLTFE